MLVNVLCLFEKSVNMLWIDHWQWNTEEGVADESQERGNFQYYSK